MEIYGAGMAGLIAANMLRRYSPLVREVARVLPNNHSALLRIRSEAVALATGIPMKKVRVRKAASNYGEMIMENCPLDLCNQYSLKTNGGVLSRSIHDLSDCDRWVAPVDFPKQLQSGARITFQRPVTSEDLLKGDTHKISTLPMPTLMKMVGWEDMPDFKAKPIYTINADLEGDVDVHQTIYFPSPEDDCYRASITGKRLIIEQTSPASSPIVAETVVHYVKHTFGISEVLHRNVKCREQSLGKITPICEATRKAFVLRMTQDFGIYSLGRFATWRNILLDDVVRDVEVIEKIILNGPYSAALTNADAKK